ncbi:hypothetical protein NL676_000736 [Syzygium grande]|nr:hypothetical protein NL676_000736 [Syzygium grande]
MAGYKSRYAVNDRVAALSANLCQAEFPIFRLRRTRQLKDFPAPPPRTLPNVSFYFCADKMSPFSPSLTRTVHSWAGPNPNPIPIRWPEPGPTRNPPGDEPGYELARRGQQQQQQHPMDK